MLLAHVFAELVEGKLDDAQRVLRTIVANLQNLLRIGSILLLRFGLGQQS
jgi:hypothetical protein